MSTPFLVDHQLAGWELVWVQLTATGDESGVAALRQSAEERARAAYTLEGLSAHPTVAALRALFHAAGCDPTRYRPSSEALLRRVLKGDPLPAIHPLVDLNNCLSITLAVPSSMLAEGSFAPPVMMRAGRPLESYDSMRGSLGLEGKPLLTDGAGPFASPITDSQRAKVQPETNGGWLVAYLPQGVVSAAEVEVTLNDLLRQAPVAKAGDWFVTFSPDSP
jgi:DNA/RNA-binding domain of Phe-tRNA-synthetase-like protein